MAEPVHPDPELLLAQASWLRALAARLARDPHAAEDLVQDTWLAALEGPRQPVRSWKDWLGGVLANRARSRRRGEARRRVREAAGARPDPALDPGEAVAKAALGRELLDLVLALEEPFRGALLLRYWEDLPPRAIAERLGVSVRTVDSRLARAHARLRERWERRHGDDARTALEGLALLASGSRPLRHAAAAALPSTPAGALALLLMNAKLVVAAVLVVGSASLLWLARTPEPAPLAAPAADAGLVPERPPLQREPELSSAPRDVPRPERVAVATAPSNPLAGPTIEPPESASLHVVRGRVLGVDATPLAGVDVALRAFGDEGFQPVRGDEEGRATSGAGGWFELAMSAPSGTLASPDPALVTVLECLVRAGTEAPAVVVVAERSAFAGRVVDEDGAPLAGARVRVLPPAGFASRFDARLDASALGEWGASSDAAGAFALDPVPLFRGGMVEARLEGFETASVPAPSLRDEGLVLVLHRPAAASTTLAGRVLDAAGRPAPGSRVSLGARSAVADAAGAFELDRADAVDATALVAVRPGALPARYEPPRDPATGAPVWPASVTLTLGGEPLELRGRVVDADGEPRQGVRVWLDDPTPFGIVGEDTKAQVESLIVLSDEDARDGVLDEAYWSPTATDADGRFRIGGLLDRPYAPRLMDPETLASAVAGPFVPGPETRTIVFDEGELGPVAGRVTSPDGAPLSGVRVSIGAFAFGGISSVAGETSTDAQGRFRFERLGGTRRTLWLRGEDVVPAHLDFADGPLEDLAVVLARRCSFKVDLAGRPERADRLYVLADDDEALDLYLVDAHGTTTMHSAPLVAGRSVHLGVDERARTLVLEKNGAAVQRVPIQLAPGRLEILQP